MENQTDVQPSLHVDKKAGQRYEHVIEIGKKIFADSALIDASKPVTANDLELITQFHRNVSPTNPDNPWRLTKEDGSIQQGRIAESSVFSNWEAPGGPLEHINLATKAAAIIVEELKSHLRSGDEITEAWVADAIRQAALIDASHAAATAALHDEGREVTHLFYTNELIGRRLLKRIGIREDIRAVLPDEKIMQVPLNQSMDEYMQQMPAEAIIIRIADEFGKRKGGTNRILQPEDYDPLAQEKWAEGYLKRPPSGRPSEKWMRQNIMLHNANVPRYFEAMDKWIQAISTLNLYDITRKLNEELSGNILPLNESSPLS